MAFSPSCNEYSDSIEEPPSLRNRNIRHRRDEADWIECNAIVNCSASKFLIQYTDTRHTISSEW